MKVTEASTYRLMQTNLNRITNDLLNLRNQGATGLKLNKASDDPTAVRPVLTTRSQLQQNARYLETMGQAGDKMAAIDGHLANVENVLARAKEIAINSINSSMSQSDLNTFADEVAQLREQLLDSANAVVDGKYIFSGYLEDTPPFTKNENYDPALYDQNDVTTWPYLYQGDYHQTELEITPGEFMKVNLTGNELFMGITNTIAANGYANPYQGETISSGALAPGTPGNDIVITNNTTPPTTTTISGAVDLTDNPGETNYAGKVASLFSQPGTGLLATATAASKDLGPLSLSGFVPGDTYQLDIASGGNTVSVTLDGPNPPGTYDFTLDGLASALAATPGATNTTATGGTLPNGVSYDISSGSLILTGPADGSEIDLAETLTGAGASGGISGGSQTVYGSFSITTNTSADVDISGAGLASVGLSNDTLSGASGNTDMFTVLTKLEEALRAGNTGEMQTQLANLEVAADQNRSLRSNLGARAARVDRATLHQEDARVDLEQILSRYQDADIIEVYNDILQKETAFQSALNITGRVSKISILDYF